MIGRCVSIFLPAFRISETLPNRFYRVMGHVFSSKVMASKSRLEVVKGHLLGGSSCSKGGTHIASIDLSTCGSETDTKTSVEKEAPTIPKRRQELLKWNGWGYKDSKFILNKDDQVHFTGERYRLSGETMPALRDWMIATCGISLEHKSPCQPEFTAADVPAPVKNDGFMNDLLRTGIHHTDDCQDRLFRAHGHTLHEVFVLREGKFQRIPDIVVWPKCHNDVVKIVDLACKYNVVVIPFGDLIDDCHWS